jgi:hypothetical protein
VPSGAPRDFFVAGRADYAKVATIQEGDGDFVTDPADLPFRATITWDDGTSTTGTIVNPNAGPNNMDIFATHNFPRGGSYSAAIRVDELGEPLPFGSGYDGFNAQVTVKVIDRPTSADGVIDLLRNLFPDVDFNVTSGQRTVAEQAGLMLNQALNNPSGLLSTYGNANYAQDMVNYLVDNPVTDDASRAAALDYFTNRVQQARDAGQRVSDHLDDNARDISVPQSHQTDIMCVLQAIGARLITNEPGNEPHWHISYRP